MWTKIGNFVWTKGGLITAGSVALILGILLTRYIVSPNKSEEAVVTLREKEKLDEVQKAEEIEQKRIEANRLAQSASKGATEKIVAEFRDKEAALKKEHKEKDDALEARKKNLDAQELAHKALKADYEAAKAAFEATKKDADAKMKAAEEKERKVKEFVDSTNEAWEEKKKSSLQQLKDKLGKEITSVKEEINNSRKGLPTRVVYGASRSASDERRLTLDEIKVKTDLLVWMEKRMNDEIKDVEKKFNDAIKKLKSFL